MARGPRGCWTVHVAGAGVGTSYGYRADGPWHPPTGRFHNPAKLLVDPYARAIAGPSGWHRACEGGQGTPDPTDDAAHKPRGLVVDDAFDWQGVAPPRTPWADTVIYEAQVRAVTAGHADVPEQLRGTWLGLAQPAVIEHLQALGVTAIELLPPMQAWNEQHLVEQGLVNAWGYGTIGWFAPDSRFAAGGPGESVREFRTMVRELHRAGIEVLIDVVFNHTPEGRVGGPLVSLRGLDGASYYASNDDGPVDFTGCGNTLDLQHPRVLQLVMDSLRWWVQGLGVDGFRFDLAPALARVDGCFDPGAAFFAAVEQDPVLAGVKLIAEPWDIGPGGYQLGHFGPGWAEWNGDFRDVVRRFWQGERGAVPALATRLAGSQDLFAGRGPLASVNFIACHDGFTLRDLLSYSRKRNHANGEANRDGRNFEHQRAWGGEGDDVGDETLGQRQRLARSLLLTLACARGVPLLSHGDERGRTQRGNNNAYCHADERVELDWGEGSWADAMQEFTQQAFALRRALPPLRLGEHLTGEPPEDPDAVWLGPAGPLTGSDWSDRDRKALGLRLAGAEPVLVLLNANEEPTLWSLPDGTWTLRLASGPAEVRGRSAHLGAQTAAVFTAAR